MDNQSWKGWREEKMEELEGRAKELYRERLEDLPPGVFVSTSELYFECWEKAEEEILYG